MEETMKRILLVFVFVILCFVSINAQSTTTSTTTSTTPSSENIITANSQITEVRLNGFEDASFWNVAMPIDQGFISKQSRRGVPKDVSSDTSPFAKRDEKYGIPRSYSREKVLGIRVEYIARGYNWFAIRPVKPIVIEGICQSVSVWIAGRNYKHWLKALIQDFYGNERSIYVDKLTFIGWKELTFSIPDIVAQRDFHFIDKQGIKFSGFVVECDPVETFGVYYLYFDELRAMTDIFNEKTRDVDDMRDDW
jgi:hypothetical protein